jgi:hypothetical protein
MSNFEGGLLAFALLGLWFLDRLIGAVRAVAHHLGRIADAAERRTEQDQASASVPRA